MKKVNFETTFFQKKDFKEDIIKKYFNNALKDLKIASNNQSSDVIFKFTYDALIKIGITLIAFNGYRIKSRLGHHIKILEKLSEILKEENIQIIGDGMRKKRNLDLYECGTIISEKEAKDYLLLVRRTAERAKSYLKSQNLLWK